MDCPLYERKRAGLIKQVCVVLANSASELLPHDFKSLCVQEKCEVLLGKRIGDPVAENRIDSAVKRCLTKAWNLRSGVTASINAVLDTKYSVRQLG